MKTKLTIIITILLASAVGVFSQNGGKAEPLRIKFVKGKTSAILNGTLKQHQEMEYNFSARKGQKVRVVIDSTVPISKDCV